ECQARVDSTLRTYTLTSEDFDVSLSGDFLLTKLVKDVAVSIKEYTGMFDQNQEQINAYYKAKERSVHPYRADLTINARHPNAYLSYLGLPVTLSDQSYLEAVFSQKNDSYISVYAFADSVTYGDRLFLDNSLDINASKDRDSTGVLALFQISSKEQYWDVIPYTTGFTAEAIWSNDLIDLTLSAAQPANGSRADIHSEIRLANGTTDIHLLPSRLKVFDKEWNISRTNRVRFVDDKILFSNLELFHLEQSVKIDGVLSDSLATLLDISFEKFDLENLNTLIPKKLNGIVNGSGRFYRTSSNESMRFELGLDIREMMFEGVLLGDFTGISEWDRARNGLYLDFGLVRENINTMRINGYVRPGKTEELRIEARFDRANLNLLEPLFSQLVSGVDGTASGEFEIVGTFEDPEIYGFARVNDGRVTLDYLNTTYQFSGLTRFEDNLILLRDLKFTDRFGNRAILKGSVKHHRFTNFFTDLDIAHTNFELLNTNRTQNSLYYGNAYGTGTIRVVGPIENILIKAEATSMPNTRIYIPFIEEQSVEKKDYITFSAKSGLKSDEPANKKTNLTGITMDFDLNVTEDAYMELIFNPRTGDIIRGRGDGNLQLRINTSGDFEMFGRYEVRDGAYNFTTSLINKELQVKPGGSITWYGDPYAGILDIEATYRQLADISDWEAPQTTSAFSTPSQKYPVLVVLGLKGAMMSPAISFRMEMEQSNAPGLDDRWRQMLSAVNGNEEELKRQVFSLLVLRKFSRQNSFVVSAGFQSGLSSVSEFVSNQLSYWLNQVDENLEVSIDLNTLSPDAFNTFQLRLAYTFLDGRLRVTRGGGVTTVVDQNPGFGSILGDWSVEYVLTQDGRWRARVFSRANQLAVHQDMTGASFQFVQSFDELSEIFQKTRKQTVPDAGTDPPSID
ncbi:MAG: translocation/assembly module TamB, partial [Cyclobacteriaceae bacterium]|nr:translocation/assembly module TamB [Cyclobacteriaceae bacterium]